MTVDGFIDALPTNEKKVAEQVRALIFESVPGIEEKISYTLPFYHYFGMFLYLCPRRTKGLDVTFCRGIDLIDAFPFLEMRGRAIAASLILETPKDIFEKDLPQLIITAAEWNREAKRLGIPMVKKK